jgi:hypothetical protein
MADPVPPMNGDTEDEYWKTNHKNRPTRQLIEHTSFTNRAIGGCGRGHSIPRPRAIRAELDVP